ncbi:response regulator receiver domain [Aliifodinibius sp. S!AR15-10]|uniref:response regulator receiver domain n=1 Tax=Aliifodinibius sp. S!AR15-10 TaxID=2950437 RepID=UPI002865D89D|nr:response regulator receiver domain [Aliifodinibius sp. S!AR15-10]MDR8391408.1 response regulator receiver domain [Aliifodinibius sp. S!AR15-10]
MSEGEFTEVAKGIVKESISSGIFIDDKTLMAFEEKGEDADLDNPSELYNSFRKRNCSLDIYRYQPDSWEGDLDYILNNRDLIILDWQLDGDEPNYVPALNILESAIKAKNIHFICIYTQIPEPELLEKVVYQILGYFCNNTENFDNAQFRQNLDQKGLVSDEVIEKLSPILKELAIYKDNREKRGSIKGDLVKYLNEKFEDGIEEFRNLIEEHFSDFDQGILELGYHLNRTEVRDEIEDNKFDLRISEEDDEKTVFINQTVIKIRAKKDIDKDRLYDNFTDSLLNEHNIFLTLLGLELRNLFRKSSAFIGKELEGIDELAFFHHHDQYTEEDTVEAFYEFLREIWRDQASSFLLEENPQLLKFLNKYKAENGIVGKLEEFKSDSNFSESLSTLNLVYNKLNVIRKTDDIIRFGDVFYSEIDDETKFFICLTPHCDCLRAEKIDHNYFFTEGKEINLSTGLEKAETDFVSFIMNNQEKLSCIDWEKCKPFSFYISDNQIGSKIEVAYKGAEIELHYLCSIKENYAQRIANNAFSNPMRVGIVMANTKEAE